VLHSAQGTKGEPVRVWIFTVATVVLSLALAAPANAAFPGQNGKIAYVRHDADTDEITICMVDPGGGGVQCPINGGEPAWSSSGTRLAFTGGGIWTANADGSGAAPLTSDPDGFSAWSPDGSRITFARFANACVPTCIGEIYVMDADGTNAGDLTNDPADDDQPAWSPDGRLIAWQRADSRIWTMKPDGTGKTDLASGVEPNWSPDGTRLAFARGGTIWVMNADGSGQTQLTSGSDGEPAWSPDGTQIAFSRLDFTAETEGIWKVDVDGSNVTPVVTEPGRFASIRNPDWQPLPVNTSSTYPRPKGATPMYLSLVPAYNPCTASNRTHGPPLAYASCNPPAPGSPNLTVGVGDGSPALSRSIGSVSMTLQGLPAPPEDSDVRIRFSLTNVMKASDLSEYTGELRGTLTVRRTDREPGTISSTTQDFPFSFTVPCTPTPGSSLDASTCQVDTSVDAVIPSAIKDAQRAIWALDKLRVYDGGPDGDADTVGDNSLFATQGIFVP
jgi:WD40-like Beta Propeller Repeat